jgi:hypothetical protein
MRFTPSILSLESATFASPRAYPGRSNSQRAGRPGTWTRSQLKSPGWLIQISQPSPCASSAHLLIRRCSQEDAATSSCEQWLSTREERVQGDVLDKSSQVHATPSKRQQPINLILMDLRIQIPAQNNACSPAAAAATSRSIYTHCNSSPIWIFRMARGLNTPSPFTRLDVFRRGFPARNSTIL